MIRRLRRCGHAPGAISPQDQAVVDQSRAMLTAVRNPQPWTPGAAQDIAVRVGPFIERAHTRPGDHGPDLIAVALVHPDTPHAAGYLHGRRLGYTERGRLRCETSAVLGFRQPGCAILTHAAANLPLPDDVGMEFATGSTGPWGKPEPTCLKQHKLLCVRLRTSWRTWTTPPAAHGADTTARHAPADGRVFVDQPP